MTPTGTPKETPAERGGVLLRLGAGADGLGFVPAAVARRLTTLSSLTPVLGTRPPVAGIALADGTVVTVLRIGRGSMETTGSRTSSAPRASSAPSASRASGVPAPSPSRPAYQPGEDWLVPGSDRAVLCHLGGFDVALTGATVVATGVFDAAPEGDGVVWRNASVPLLDVRALYAQAEAAIWAAASTARMPASQRASQRPSQPVSRRLSVPAPAPEEDEEEPGRQAILPAAPGDEGGGSA